MKPSLRKKARELTIQALYQHHMTGASSQELIIQFLERTNVDKVDTEYFQELVNNIPKQFDDLDRPMKELLDRPFDQLDPIELNVLRLAIYELKHRPDVPYQVVINEALELNKKFGTIDGHKFVNGILDKIAATLRSTEINNK